MVAGHKSASFDLNNKFITEHSEVSRSKLRFEFVPSERPHLVNAVHDMHYENPSLLAA
jgi:hypothetical protein